MKTAVWLILSLGSFSAFGAQPPTPAGPAPQPRVRLEQTAGGATARVVTSAATSAEPTPLMMPKVVVADSKLPAGPSTAPDPEPTRFSPLRGGPVFSGKVGSLPLQVGVWPWYDILAADAKLKPPRTRVDFELLRIQW
jgi:hypothetical protein